MAFDIYLDCANIVNHSVSIECLCQFLNKLCMYETCYSMILCGISSIVCLDIFVTLLYSKTHCHQTDSFAIGLCVYTAETELRICIWHLNCNFSITINVCVQNKHKKLWMSMSNLTDFAVQ